MPNLSTILHRKSNFFVEMLVLLNKYTTFAMCFIVKHARKGSTIKIFRNNAKSIVNSWKNLYSHCELQVINIEQQ